MFKLTEEHQKKVEEILQRNRKKKNCSVCYDRGFTGYTPEDELIPCHKCVNEEEAMKEWKEYVLTVPELYEHYKDSFEEEKEE